MNQVIDYVRALNPVNEKKDLISAINQLQDELTDFTIPTAKDLQTVFAGHKFKSPYMTSIVKEMRKYLEFTGSPIDAIVNSAVNLQSNCELLESEAKRLFSFQFTRSNLTYRRVNLLRYVESAHFYVRYLRKLMLRLVAEEALAVGGATPMGWARGEIAWQDKNLANFAGLFAAMSMPEAKLRQALNTVSDATVEEETFDTAVQTLGMSNLDPFRMSQFSPTSNWFFSFGKMLAEWKVKRFKNAKEEHLALQLRLQEYRELTQEGKSTPKLQQLIKHTEERIEKLDYQIHRIEEENRY